MKKTTKRWLIGTAMFGLLVLFLLARPVFHLCAHLAARPARGRDPSDRDC